MAKPGQNIGNKHAAVKGRRRRVAFTISLSGERLAKVVRWLEAQDIEATDMAVAEEARQWLNPWIDGLNI